jgi:antitoxin (DNA-binding transcriptional repressor) of toxin-antitoxin stability system
MTKTVSMAQAKAALSELASRTSSGERFVLLRRGKPVAGLVSAGDVSALEGTAEVATFMNAILAFRRRQRGRLPSAPIDPKRSPPRRVR